MPGPQTGGVARSPARPDAAFSLCIVRDEVSLLGYFRRFDLCRWTLLYGVLAAVLAFVNPLRAASPAGTVSPKSAPVPRHAFEAAWVSGNFDGNARLDWVAASPSARGGQRYDLLFHFDEQPNGAFAAQYRFTQQKLLARDVDGDADTDLVLETPSSQLIAVWINDGKGHFKEAKEADVERYRKFLALADSDEYSASRVAWLPDESCEGPGASALAHDSALRAPRFLPAALDPATRIFECEAPAHPVQARGPPERL